MNAGKEMSREKAIREIAETVFADNKKKGLPPDAMRDWTQAEKIYDNKVYYCLLWHPSKLLEKYYHKVVAAGIILIILLIGLIVNVDRNIGEMRVRPYLEVDPVYPVMIDNADGGNTYFGNYILLKNMGRSPAVNVKVAYYMTTEVDSNKSVGPGWFDQKTEGVSFLGFVAPGTMAKEPGFRALSPSASYFYFEAVVSYLGPNSQKRYWSHTRRVFKVDKASKKLVLLSDETDWDKNKYFSIPRLSNDREIRDLLAKAGTK